MARPHWRERYSQCASRSATAVATERMGISRDDGREETVRTISLYLCTGSIRSISRYSVSSAPSMHASHWSNSGVPCLLQKYRRQRLHVMKVILTRSSASH